MSIRLQQAHYTRPYYIYTEKIDGTIREIVVYDDNGEIFKTRGWFETSDTDGKYATGDVKEVYLNNLVKRNKVNLTRKENFVTGCKDEMTLYIYVDNKYVTVEKVKTVKENFRQEYLLQTAVHHYNIYHVLIGDTEFYTKIFTHIENIEHEEKENAAKIYELIKDKIYGVPKTVFYTLYNACKVELREKPLI